MAATKTLHSISPKNHRYTIIIFIFIVLSLFTIFLFTKRTLEPSLSLHTTTSATQSPIPSSPISLRPKEQESVIDRGDLTADGIDNVGNSDSDSDSVFESAEGGEEEDKQFEGFRNESVVAGGTVKKKISNVGDSDSDSVSESAQGEEEEEDKQFEGFGNESVVAGGAVKKTDDLEGAVSEEVKKLRKCDLYKGKWVKVKDDEYPIYEAGSCPYVDEAFDCQTNGRADSAYLRWRWKPDACDLPRFNATDFLERLRGKKLMLVGDSMNRNQFESILCLLREGLPNKTKMYEIHGYKITKGRGYYDFKFEDYDCSVQFVRSHFLVREGIRVNAQGNSNPTLSIDRIDKSSRRWKQADILVFNTGHWWTHGKTARGKNYYQEGGIVYPKFDAVEAYRKSLKTWAKWIDKNIDTKKQMIFYRGYSNAHYRGGDWDSGGSCNGETDPILNGPFLDNYPLKMKIVEEAIKEMQVPVILLNVTRLTNFRKDGHPSIYGKSLTSGRKVSTRRQDCSHWCLPGVPDAWNEMIYVTLLMQQYSTAA